MNIKIIIVCLLLIISIVFIKKYYELYSINWDTENCSKIRLYLSNPKKNINDLQNINFSNVNMTLLQIATKKNQLNCVRLLLNNSNIDINRKNNIGKTAIHYCAEKWKGERNDNNKAICKLLSSRSDININIKDNNDFTPLMVAAQSGNIECVKLLLSTPNININLVNNENHSALYLSISKHQTIVSQILISHPDINVNNLIGPDGENMILKIAILKRKIDIIKSLLLSKKIKKIDRELYPSLKNKDENIKEILNLFNKYNLLKSVKGYKQTHSERPTEIPSEKPADKIKL
jgi:ankyrin repeat protein